MSFTTIALLATGAVGMLGWFFAWRGRGDVLEATTSELAARQLTFQATAAASAADTKYQAEKLRTDQLQAQLDSERASKQALIDALAKAGSPVGPVVVDSSLDRLYQDGDQGGQGPNAGVGGGPAGVSGQPAPAAGPPAKG
ncbi:MAG TPA: hypothetical protein VJZ73_13250 [Methylomirabilota bacterium]|nr:hypothetical protein [Methylomirabilota bacterium]